MNVQWSVHWGCNYQETLALLKNPSSVHLIGAYCKWRELSTKDPNSRPSIRNNHYSTATAQNEGDAINYDLSMFAVS